MKGSRSGQGIASSWFDDVISTRLLQSFIHCWLCIVAAWEAQVWTRNVTFLHHARPRPLPSLLYTHNTHALMGWMALVELVFLSILNYTTSHIRRASPDETKVRLSQDSLPVFSSESYITRSSQSLRTLLQKRSREVCVCLIRKGNMRKGAGVKEARGKEISGSCCIWLLSAWTRRAYVCSVAVCWMLFVLLRHVKRTQTVDYIIPNGYVWDLKTFFSRIVF